MEMGGINCLKRWDGKIKPARRRCIPEEPDEGKTSRPVL